LIDQRFSGQPAIDATPEPAWCGCLRAGCTGTVAILLPVERLICNPALAGNRRFNHSETILPVQVRLIPFFALGFQVFSMILSTFFCTPLFRRNTANTEWPCARIFSGQRPLIGRFVRYFDNIL
jgi:hypothetical protein